MKLVKRYGASEVLGALLITVMVATMAVLYVGWTGEMSKREVVSIVDAIRVSERRQKQLLSLIYAYRDEQGNIHLYIYNYGATSSTISKLIVKGYVITGPGVIGRVLPPKSGPHELIFPCTARGQVDIILMTAEGGIFIWRTVI